MTKNEYQKLAAVNKLIKAKQEKEISKQHQQKIEVKQLQKQKPRNKK